jgi:hypothetical protein
MRQSIHYVRRQQLLHQNYLTHFLTHTQETILEIASLMISSLVAKFNRTKLADSAPNVTPAFTASFPFSNRTSAGFRPN